MSILNKHTAISNLDIPQTKAECEQTDCLNCVFLPMRKNNKCLRFEGKKVQVLLNDIPVIDNLGMM